MDEEERLVILERLDRDQPGKGLSTRAAGRLAGRATIDRPDVPVWEYLDYLSSHPGSDRAEFVAIRFPVIFFGGEDSTIASVEEYLQGDPVPAHAPQTFEWVVGLWRHLHEAGIVEWNSELRAVQHVQPFAEYGQALKEWERLSHPAL